MTVTNRQFAYTVQAAEDLSAAASRHKVITLAGTIFSVAAGNSGRAAGVNVTACKSGEYASFVYDGIAKVVAGAAVSTLGYPLTVASGGFMIAASSGGPCFGRALATAASGDLFQALVDFKTVPAWGGV